MNAADPDALAQRFWSELKEVRTGMLGLVDAREALAQPMTAHFEGAAGPLWFFARSDGDLTGEARVSSRAVFNYVGPKHELYACVHGELVVVRDPEVMRRFWTEEVARWFPNGPEDESVTLLRFDPQEAQIWLPAEAADASVVSMSPGRDIRARTSLSSEARH